MTYLASRSDYNSVVKRACQSILVLSTSVAILAQSVDFIRSDEPHSIKMTADLTSLSMKASPFFNASSSSFKPSKHSYRNVTSFEHNSRTNSSFEEISEAAGDSETLVRYLNIWICTLLAVFGCVSNFISFMIFMRAGRFPPKITTRNSLIVLTVSNSIFLILYWYDNVFPRLIDLFESPADHHQHFLRKLYLNNSNAFFCKFIPYAINVTMCLNATITVSFSLERAFAIYFPLKLINLKQTCPYLNRTVILFNIFLSLILPAYYLFVLEITKIEDKHLCDATEEHKPLYFTLTVAFFIVIFGLPFIIITISNIAIVVRLYQNKMILAHKQLARGAASRLNSEREDTTNIIDLNNEVPVLRKNGGGGSGSQVSSATCLTKKLIEYSASCNNDLKDAGRTAENGGLFKKNMKKRYDMILKLKGSQQPTTQLYEMTNLNRIERVRHDSLPMTAFQPQSPGANSHNQHHQYKCIPNNMNGSNLGSRSTLSPRARSSISVPMQGNYNYLSVNNGNAKNAAAVSAAMTTNKSIRKSRSYLNQNFRITKMLLTISASFVLLNFPYFLAWCIYANFRLNNDIHYDDDELYNQTALRFRFVKLAEMLNLFNYSITGLLYFASGKIYRAHLYCIFGCSKRNRIKFRL